MPHGLMIDPVFAWLYPLFCQRHAFSLITKLEEVLLLFVARIDVFDFILGQPTNADLTRIQEDLTSFLLPLPYDVEKGIHNLMGTVMYKDDYKVRYGAKFPKTNRPAV